MVPCVIIAPYMYMYMSKIKPHNEVVETLCMYSIICFVCLVHATSITPFAVHRLYVAHQEEKTW